LLIALLAFSIFCQVATIRAELYSTYTSSIAVVGTVIFRFENGILILLSSVVDKLQAFLLGKIAQSTIKSEIANLKID
jgi:hypothetical protein